MNSPEVNSTPTEANVAPPVVNPETTTAQKPKFREVPISLEEGNALIAELFKKRGVEKAEVFVPPRTISLKAILKIQMMKRKSLSFINPDREPELHAKLTRQVEAAKRQANEIIDYLEKKKKPDGTNRFDADYIAMLRSFVENPDLALMDSSRRSFWKAMQREQIDGTANAELESNTPDVKLADALGGNNQGSFYFDGLETKEARGFDPLTGEPIWDDNILIHYINGQAARNTFESVNQENALRPDMRCDFLFLRNTEHRGKGINCLMRKRAAFESANEALVLSNGESKKIYGRHARLAGMGDMAVMDRVVQNAFLKLQPDKRKRLVEAIQQRMPEKDRQEARLFLAQQRFYNEFKKANPDREPDETELAEIGEKATAEADDIELFPADTEKFLITAEMLKGVEIDRSVEVHTGFGMLVLTEIQSAESPSDELSAEYRHIRGVNENGYQLRSRIIMGGDSARAAADTGRDGHWVYREDVEDTPLVEHLRRVKNQLARDQANLEIRRQQAAALAKGEKPPEAGRAQVQPPGESPKEEVEDFDDQT